MIMNCDRCGSVIVHDVGKPTARALIAGEFPGEDELRRRMVFVGKIGEILFRELAVAGVSPNKVLYTNLWTHHKNDKLECENDMVIDLLRKMENKDVVLLMGSEFGTLFNYSVMNMSGMQVDHPLFPSGVKVMACPNPTIVMHSTVGELRLALHKFSEVMKHG